MRSQPSRYSPFATATCLVLLAACGSESARPGPASEGARVVTSAVLASDVGTNSGPTSNTPNGRPMLEKRATASAQVVGDQPAQRGTDAGPDVGSAQAQRGSDATRPADTDSEGRFADDGDDTDPEGCFADDGGDDGPEDHDGDDPGGHDEDDPGGHDEDDPESHDEDDDDQVGADEDGCEPKVSAREKTLAWLAEESVGENLPAPTARTSGGGSVARIVLPGQPLEFVRPDAVKGIYLNAWAAGSAARSQALIDLATRTEVNTFVIDLKDASGYVSYATEVMMAREVGADQEIRIRDLMGLLERVQEAGIYPIARIVMVKDPLLIRARREWAVQDTAGGVWVDSNGLIWANLHDQRVWDYHVDLAKEAAALGFPEIQWDYVRFADAPKEDLDRAVYPGADGQSRRDVVEAFLEYARAELEDSGVAMTLDVFGATTSALNDVGIGQYWESFIGSVDVALPMVYPSHYWEGSFRIQDPNGHPYEIVRAALLSAVQRSEAVEGAGVTRPWLQDFTLGPPRYEAPEVRAQIQATYDAGIDEWVLWNAGSRYTEAALEPVDGYPRGVEPEMRVGGRIVPVSERYAAMVAEAEERALARAVADSIAAAVVADSIAAAVVADSLAGAVADGVAAETGSPEAVAGIRR